jgi:Na+-driven multidrug efflux pump
MRNVCDVRIRHIVNPSKSLTIKLCMLGLPAGITQAIFSMSAIVVSKLTNSIGVAMMAANTAIMRVDGYAMMPNFTFGTAATTYVGQNIGARKGDRLKTGRSALLRLALISSCILVGCILVFGELLLGLFIDDPNPQKVEEALALAKQGLQTLALGYICFSVTQVLQGAMRGAGETFVPMVISIVTTVIVRMPLAYLLAALTKSEEWPNGAPESIFLSLLVSWVLGMVLSIIAYRLNWWRKKLPEELRHSL